MMFKIGAVEKSIKKIITNMDNDIKKKQLSDIFDKNRLTIYFDGVTNDIDKKTNHITIFCNKYKRIINEGEFIDNDIKEYLEEYSKKNLLYNYKHREHKNDWYENENNDFIDFMEKFKYLNKKLDEKLKKQLNEQLNEQSDNQLDEEFNEKINEEINKQRKKNNIMSQDDLKQYKNKILDKNINDTYIILDVSCKNIIEIQ